MKSVTLTQKQRKVYTPKKAEDIIILPFEDLDDDLEQILKEMREDEMLAEENQAINLMAEIKILNAIRLTELPRVA
jgi:hypothetical protein